MGQLVTSPMKLLTLLQEPGYEVENLFLICQSGANASNLHVFAVCVCMECLVLYFELPSYLLTFFNPNSGSDSRHLDYIYMNYYIYILYIPKWNFVERIFLYRPE